MFVKIVFSGKDSGLFGILSAGIATPTWRKMGCVFGNVSSFKRTVGCIRKGGILRLVWLVGNDCLGVPLLGSATITGIGSEF